jgi:hypothetical protein
MVHGCTLFLPLQTRTTGLWTNNEQPKRRNEMSDKMITPEEYLIENPTHMIYKDDDRSESTMALLNLVCVFIQSIKTSTGPDTLSHM